MSFALYGLSGKLFHFEPHSNLNPIGKRIKSQLPIDVNKALFWNPQKKCHKLSYTIYGD